MATIRDVSKLAGVSVATVSRVINGSGYVNKETEKAVRDAMKALNYKPSVAARTLAGKQSSTVALIVPDILNPFFPEIARSIEDAAQELGYTLVLCNSDNDPDKEMNYFRILESKHIDGIIIASYTIVPRQIMDLQEKSIPVVVIDNPLPGYPILSLVTKHREGARKAVRHLIDQGCRKIAHICGPLHVYSARERALGYEEVCRGQGNFAPSLIYPGDFRIDGGYEAMIRLFEQHPDIDGVFAGNDLMAIGALKALYHMGKSVPDDVKLIGYDGISLSMVVPELSTVAQPMSKMGKLAMNFLMKLIRKEPVELTIHELEAELIIRKSTSKPVG